MCLLPLSEANNLGFFVYFYNNNKGLCANNLMFTTHTIYPPSFSTIMFPTFLSLFFLKQQQQQQQQQQINVGVEILARYVYSRPLFVSACVCPTLHFFYYFSASSSTHGLHGILSSKLRRVGTVTDQSISYQHSLKKDGASKFLKPLNAPFLFPQLQYKYTFKMKCFIDKTFIDLFSLFLLFLRCCVPGP